METPKTEAQLDDEFFENFIVATFSTPDGRRAEEIGRRKYHVDKPVFAFTVGETDTHPAFRDGRRVFWLNLAEMKEKAKQPPKPKQRKAKS